MTASCKKIFFLLKKVAILLLLACINVYRYMLKFILINEGCCYAPSCSAYMEEALTTHGFFKGVSLGLRRIARCHPWRHPSTPLYDPVPHPHSVRKDIPWIQKKEI